MASSRPTLLAVLVISAAALLAYHNTFAVPLHFDDASSIRDNPTIRSLWHAWWPPNEAGLTVSGRPLLNFSLALNYAVSGTAVWSYHGLNLLIHILVGGVLFGIVRRTLRQPVLAARFGADADWLGLGVALLWVLHPLQTESVTYIVQRAESLAALCYLLTLWCFIRSVESGAARSWRWLSFAACLLGMMAKEIMVTAPLMVACYDRVFLSGSWREVWTRRGRSHLVLAETWVVLIALVVAAGNRGGTAGFGTDVRPLDYALTQVGVVVDYLRLAFWPSPLVFDYGAFLKTSVAEVALPALILVPLLGATLVALARGRPAGFCGAFFFAVLAPTSSIVPVATQTMNEHRMYLPLAAVVALVVPTLYAWLGRRSFVLWAGLALVLGVLTVRRNADYRTEMSLWEDTVKKRPGNARAQASLGIIYGKAGRLREALGMLQLANQLDPAYPEAQNNLGDLLVKLERIDEAIKAFETSLALKPNRPVVMNNLGNAYLQAGRTAEGLAQLTAAVRLEPALTGARYNLASALVQAGLTAKALPHYAAYLRQKPDDFGAQEDYGIALLGLGRRREALAALATAVQLRPDNAEAHNNLGVVLAQLRRPADALREFREAMRLDPTFTRARENAENAAREAAPR